MSPNNIPDIDQEIDLPFVDEEHTTETILSAKNVEMLEKSVNVMNALSKMKVKQRAFTLIVLCVILLTIMIAVDTWLVFIGHEISQYAANFFELLKYIVTLCIGYLFALQNKKE